MLATFHDQEEGIRGLEGIEGGLEYFSKFEWSTTTASQGKEKKF